MTTQRGGALRGPLIALGAMAVYSTHDALIKSLGGALPPPQILFFAALFTLPLLVAVLVQGRMRLWPNAPGWVALRSVAAVIAGLCGFYAFTVLPLAQVYALLFTLPLIVTVLSVPLLGEKVGIWRAGAVLLGLAGVLIVLRPGDVALGAGHAAAACGAFCSALAGVIGRRLGRSERTAVLIFWPTFCNVIVAGAIMAGRFAPMTGPEVGLLGGVAALGLIGAALLLQAFRAGEAAVVAPMQYSQIFWAVVFGWLIFDEHPDAVTLLGIGVIIASGLLILWRERSRGARPATGTPVRPPGP